MRSARAGAGALLFSVGVVSVATTYLVLRAAIAPDVFTVGILSQAGLLVVAQLLPVAALIAADRLIARRGRGPLARYRSALVAGVLAFGTWHVTARVWPAWEGDARSWLLAGAFAVVMAVEFGVALALALRLRALFLPFFQLMGIAGVVMLGITAPVSPAETSSDKLWLESVPSPPVEIDREDVPTVVIVVFDELSYDMVFDEAGQVRPGFPAFGELAAEGVVFTDATTNFFNTRLAVPFMADSIAPLADVTEVRAYVQFSEAEERIAARCGAELTCRGIHSLIEDDPTGPFRQMTVSLLADALPDPIRAPLTPVASRVAGWAGAATAVADSSGVHFYTRAHIDRLLADLNQDDAAGRVYLFHSLATHRPFIYNADGSVKYAAQEETRDALMRSSAEAARYADRLLGEILRELRETGLAEDAVVIATADHGLRTAFLGPNPSAFFGPDFSVEVAGLATHVPLVIRAPGLEPGVSRHNVQSIDLRATLFDLLGGEDAGDAVGVSAVAPQRPARDVWFVVEQRWIYRRIAGEWRFDRVIPNDACVRLYLAASPGAAGAPPACRLP